MKNNRTAWVVVAVVFGLPGACVAYDSVSRPGHMADAEALFGAILIGLAVFAIYMAIEQHRLTRAMAKHMTYPRAPSRTTNPLKF